MVNEMRMQEPIYSTNMAAIQCSIWFKICTRVYHQDLGGQKGSTFHRGKYKGMNVSIYVKHITEPMQIVLFLYISMHNNL